MNTASVCRRERVTEMSVQPVFGKYHHFNDCSYFRIKLAPLRPLFVIGEIYIGSGRMEGRKDYICEPVSMADNFSLDEHKDCWAGICLLSTSDVLYFSTVIKYGVSSTRRRMKYCPTPITTPLTTVESHISTIAFFCKSELFASEQFLPLKTRAKLIAIIVSRVNQTCRFHTWNQIYSILTLNLFFKLWWSCLLVILYQFQQNWF